MLNRLILLTYHVSSGLQTTGIIFIAHNKQYVVDDHRFVFQQDNAPSHRAKDTIKLLQQETPDLMVLISGHQTAQT